VRQFAVKEKRKKEEKMWNKNEEIERGRELKKRFFKQKIYNRLHFFLVLVGLLTIRAARVACSKTSRTPLPSFAEHSRYLYAPIL